MSNYRLDNISEEELIRIGILQDDALPSKPEAEINKKVKREVHETKDNPDSQGQVKQEPSKKEKTDPESNPEISPEKKMGTGTCIRPHFR